MTVDGRAIAEEVYTQLKPKFDALPRKARLGIVVVGDNPVIETFVRMKMRAAERLGIEMPRVSLPENATLDEVVAAEKKLAEVVEALIMQLPVPKHIDTNEVLRAIPDEKDVDALNPDTAEENRPVHAPVALAVVEILRSSGIEIAGKRTVVVGEGRLVGKPAAWLLKSLGADVSIFSLEQGSMEDLKDADIVIAGAGNPGFIKPAHLRQGVALIDAGTSELNKKVVGDADPACAEVASLFTPVPGGVGPVAVAMIFKNLQVLIERRG